MLIRTTPKCFGTKSCMKDECMDCGFNYCCPEELEKEEVKIHVVMHKITNDNLRSRCCCHLYCNSKYTHSAEIVINGIPLFLTFCKKHAKEFGTIIE